jgi:hypothetical protein
MLNPDEAKGLGGYLYLVESVDTLYLQHDIIGECKRFTWL